MGLVLCMQCRSTAYLLNKEMYMDMYIQQYGMQLNNYFTQFILNYFEVKDL